jgi:cytoskeletal protein CcmA (bactofilin family)
MLNFDRGNRPVNPPKDPPKPGLKQSLYEPPSTPAPSPAAARPTTTLGSQSLQPRDPLAPPATPAPAATANAPAAAPAANVAPGSDRTESKLSIGPNIKLKGVEISDCDVLAIEGQVDATVLSKTMEIAEPGTLKGTALIDVAEIHGHFTGELTARTKLIVHGTGRVSGTIRYGKLVVEEGGEISGDLQRISEKDERKPADARTGHAAAN